MNEYEQQANDFLTKTGSTLEARYLKYDFYFPNDKQKRDVWEIRLKRGTREYVFNFGSSINDHEQMLKKYIPNTSPEYAQRCIDEGSNLYDISIRFKIDKYLKAMEAQKQWAIIGSDDRPSAYSVLVCLSGYEPENNIDDFASEFGYTKPSEVIRVYEAVKKEFRELKSLYNDEELKLLNEIN